MCGILAIWRPGGVSTAMLEKGLDVMAHRGPDARGAAILADGTLGLGHLRLSILDLSAASNQPMTSADGRSTIVYNGEVMNYRTLRAGLGSAGDWRTDGDTEVVLESFSRSGDRAVHDWVGMFAFAQYDAREHVLHVVRDRFGIKPVYYAELPGGGYAFASEVPPLLELRGIRPEADEDTILTYLDTGLYDTGEATFFKGIRSLPGGCHARLDLRTGRLETTRYYDFPAEVSRNAPGMASPADWLAEGSRRVEEAVASHLVSDVPVGLNVSGGVNSSVLRALAGRTIADLHVFTQNYEPPYSELDWVRQASGAARLHVAELTSDAIRRDLEATVRRQAEPFGGVTVIGYDALYRQADEAGVTVLLDGNGVDELFLGYSKYLRAGEGGVRGPASIDGTSPVMLSAIDGRLRARASVRADDSLKGAFDHPARAVACRDLLRDKIPRGLRFNDRMSMGRSKELRVPFLDHRLAEFAYAVPVGDMLDGSSTKSLFRKIAQPLVGDELALAAKREVQSPQREWLASQWCGLVTDVLGSASFAERGWVDPAAATQAYDAYRQGSRGNSFPIWQWLNLELWARAFLD